MRRIGIIAVLSLLVTAFAAVPALAVTNFENAPQGAHYATGFGEPVCTITGTTVTCTGTEIVGVGNTNATVLLAVTSTFTGTCTNPGGHLVEPFTESETATTATAVSSAEFLATFGCPNPNWTPEVTGTAISFVYTLTFAGFSAPAITVTGP